MLNIPAPPTQPIAESSAADDINFIGDLWHELWRNSMDTLKCDEILAAESSAAGLSAQAR